MSDDTEVIAPDEVDGHVVVTPDESDFTPKLDTPEFIERAAAEAYSWEQLTAMSLQLAKSPLLPQAYRNRPENVMVAALMAQELGWGVTTAMRFIHVIDGKPTVSPEGMLALVRRAGHSVMGEANDKAAEVRGRRKDTGDELWCRFTMADANRAGLTGKDNWKKYPDAMLWARALGMLCRRLFSDVLLGMAYTPDEMGAVTDEKGEPITVDSRERPSSIDWHALGWKSEADMNEHRAQTKVILDALPRESRDEVRRRSGPPPDIADYSIGVWSNRHQIVVDEAKRLGLLDEHDMLLPQPTTPEPSEPGPGETIIEPADTAAEDAADAEWVAQAMGAPPCDGQHAAPPCGNTQCWHIYGELPAGDTPGDSLFDADTDA